MSFLARRRSLCHQRLPCGALSRGQRSHRCFYISCCSTFLKQLHFFILSYYRVKSQWASNLATTTRWVSAVLSYSATFLVNTHSVLHRIGSQMFVFLDNLDLLPSVGSIGVIRGLWVTWGRRERGRSYRKLQLYPESEWDLRNIEMNVKFVFLCWLIFLSGFWYEWMQNIV